MRRFLPQLACLALLASAATGDVLQPGEKSVRHVVVLEQAAALEGVTLVLAPVRGFHGVKVLAAGEPCEFSSKYGTRVYALRAGQALPEDVEELARVAFASGGLPVGEVSAVALVDPTTEIVSTVRVVSLDGDALVLEEVRRIRTGPGGLRVRELWVALTLGLVAASGLVLLAVLLRRRARAPAS